MRYQAILENMTVPLFVYWLQRDQINIFEGLDKADETTNNEYEYSTTLTGFVGNDGCILFVWAYQVNTQTVKVGWDQSFGGPPWAQSMDSWINFRFGVIGEVVEYDGRTRPRLNDTELIEYAECQGWAPYKRKNRRKTLENYLADKETKISSKSVFYDRVEKFRKLGFRVVLPNDS